MIRTLLADDSPAFRAALTAVLGEGGDFKVVGCAGSGEEAVQEASRLRPDLVVMDVVMPGLDGYDATSRIMERAPCAVVVMSSLVDAPSQNAVFRALDAGAVEAIGKPQDLHRADQRLRLLQTLRAMAAVKVVRRRRAAPPLQRVPSQRVRALALGASTGGPPALCRVLKALGPSFGAPVLVAQHLAHGFAPGLARWLEEESGMPARLVTHGEVPCPGAVYLPFDGCDLVWDQGVLCARPVNRKAAVPSVDALFESLLDVADEVVAAVLTGMGDDGARGLSLLRARGAYTLSQDEASSLVFGMPRAARDAGAVLEELPLDGLAARLRMLVNGGAE